MPVDTEYPLIIGRDGLNLRDNAAEVPISQLVDSLNWRIDENGAIVKRLGFVSWGDSDEMAGTPLAIGVFNPSTGARLLVIACSDGKVYTSPGDGSFTQIPGATGYSTTAVPSFAMFNDKVYWANGVDSLQSWDGTTLSSIGGAPKGNLLAVWRNRLWIAGQSDARKVSWSNIADPGTWNGLNFVVIHPPHGDVITAIISAPNIGSSFDGADGLLVYMNRSTHRIVDDTDNTSGAIVGGGNVMIDAGTGTSSHLSLVPLNGRIYSLSPDGIYSTDGHGTLRLESGRLGSFFRNAVNAAFLSKAAGVAWQGNYWVAVAGSGSPVNNLVLEVHASLPQTSHGDYPVMAHALPAALWGSFPGAAGDELVFADSNTADSKRLRRYGIGGGDTIGQQTLIPITANARSGAWIFGTPRPKHVRRVEATGRGNLLIGFAADLERSSGEVQAFIMPVDDGPLWNTVNWNEFQWGPNGGVSKPASRWYSRRGRLFQITVRETSDKASSSEPRLNGGSVVSGGAALYSLVVRVTPLDAEA